MFALCWVNLVYIEIRVLAHQLGLYSETVSCKKKECVFSAHKALGMALSTTHTHQRHCNAWTPRLGGWRQGDQEVQ